MKEDYSNLGRINEQIAELYEQKYEALKGIRKESPENDTYGIYKAALNRVRKPVENPRIVYQGEPGAYSDLAVRKIFGADANSEGLYQFEDAFRAIKSGAADYAVLPIENSSTGAIRQVYDLLSKYECYITAEVAVPVEHCLLALSGTRIEDIDTVYSHEQGLFQCEEFLDRHKEWNKVPQADTAGSAKMIAETGNKHAAAICSELAADIYGLEVIAKDIAYNSRNKTRFVAISPEIEFREGKDKICISFTTMHTAGSLNDVLSFFSAHSLNLVRLESRPIPERDWEYMFFLEFTGDLEDPEVSRVMDDLSGITGMLRVYGNFRSNI